MQVHKADMSHIAREAERIEKEAGDRGDYPNLKFYKWRMGDNHIRICPPWSAKGLIFKEQVQHFRLQPENKIIPCYCRSWPDKVDECFVCDGLDKILAMFPELDLKRQRPSFQYQANIVDRLAEDEGIQICRFTPALYNWVTAQMSKAAIGDITDIEDGVDIMIEKKVTKRRDGKEQTKYTPNFLPRTTPLHSEPEVLEAWLKSLFDLDRIFTYPKEEKIAEHSDYVERMVATYIRKHRSSGVGAIDRDRSRKSAKRESPKPEPGPNPMGDFDTDDSIDEEPIDGISTLEGVDPNEAPVCFGGLANPEPHPDGSIGHRDDLQKCMICMKELACIDATSNRG